MDQAKVSKLFTMATIVAGLVAAYLMYRRGEPVFGIAKKTFTNPVGSLVDEIVDAIRTDRMPDTA